MGFIRRNSAIEIFCDEHGIEWELLSDQEYKSLLKDWRASFEKLIFEKNGIKGDSAVECLKQRLPLDFYIFNMPDNRYFGVRSREPKNTFAYRVFSLNIIDRELFNREEVIMCDIDILVTSIFNHEAPYMHPELTYEV